MVILNCTASGGVPSEYTFRWFRESVELFSNDSVTITSDGNTSMLIFTVEPDHFIGYTCTISNTFTETSETEVLREACKWSCHTHQMDTGISIMCSCWHPHLPVSSPLPLPAFPVPYITPAAPNPVVLGTSINLTCSSYGMSPFNLTWSVNGSVVTSAVEVNDSLTFTVALVSTDSYTSYTCTSQNTFGMSSTSVTLEQAGTATECDV